MDFRVSRRDYKEKIKLKIIFLENYIPEKKQVPEKVYGCSYTLYPTPNLASLYNAAVLKAQKHKISLIKIKSEKEEIPEAEVYLIHSVILSYISDITLAKRIFTNKKIYFFGPAPTLFPEKFLIQKNFFVLRGETEHYIGKAIINPQKTNGVSYLGKTKIIHNKTAGIINDLDTIPFPARELDPDPYLNPKLNLNKFTNVLGSRGCANRCYFCVPNSISWARELEWKKYHSGKPPVKIRSVKSIIKELKLLKKQGFSEISFIDDQFIIGKKRTLEILEALKKTNLKYGILARADKLNDEEIAIGLSESKCQYVDIGAESFNQEVLDNIRKDIKVEVVKDAVKLLAKYNVEPKLNIMFGTSPKETREIIEDTIKETLSLPTNYCMFSIATPFPGTELEKIAQKKHLIMKDKEFNPAGIASISYPHLSGQELEKIAKDANNRFYYRPKVILKQFKKIRSVKSGFLLIKTFFNWRKNLK